MILEVHYTVYVPPSSHGAAQAHRFFSFCKIQPAKFSSQEKGTRGVST